MAQGDIVGLLIMATVAGLAMPAGAILATYQGIQPKWLEKELRHGILALGAGALISAVGLVLVPEGIKDVSVFAAIMCFGKVVNRLNSAASR